MQSYWNTPTCSTAWKRLFYRVHDINLGTGRFDDISLCVPMSLISTPSHGQRYFSPSVESTFWVTRNFPFESRSTLLLLLKPFASPTIMSTMVTTIQHVLIPYDVSETKTWCMATCLHTSFDSFCDFSLGWQHSSSAVVRGGRGRRRRRRSRRYGVICWSRTGSPRHACKATQATPHAVERKRHACMHAVHARSLAAFTELSFSLTLW